MLSKLLVLLVLSFPFVSFALEVAVFCPKGKVKIGDSNEKVVKYCGDTGSFQAGVRQFGQKKIPMTFKIIDKKFEDGSQVTFVFIDKKLAFILP
jgi:hypothetical protein